MSFTLIIILATCAISFLGFNNETLFNQLKHYPYKESRDKEYYRWVTSGFLHADVAHLFVNMFVMHSFGSYVEAIYANKFGMLGRYIFVAIYLLVIIMANLSTFYKHKNWHGYGAIGASGGVAGVIFIYILYNPWSMLQLMLIIPIPAIIFGGLYLWYESYAAKNISDNVGHDAHFYGALAGVLLALISIPEILSRFISLLARDFPL
jgi:membrane associated rhomboid family serine protease